MVDHLLTKDLRNRVYAIVRIPGKFAGNDRVTEVVYDGSEHSLANAIVNSNKIIHLGAYYTTRDDEDSINNLIDSNIKFSSILFNAVNKYNKSASIVSASTFSFLDKEGVYKPVTFYAATKYAVESIAQYYADLSIKFCTLPDTYGPNDNRSKVHNLLARHDFADGPFQFRSSSKQIIRLLHVNDVIRYLELALSDIRPGVWIYDIYRYGFPITLGELSKLITDEKCEFNEDSPKVELPTVQKRSFRDNTIVEKLSSQKRLRDIRRVLKGS